MNPAIKNIAFTVIMVTLTGCATTVVPKPTDITLEAAMESVGRGLIAMRKAQGELRTGLLADEVQVTFNIAASGDQGGSLKVATAPVVANSTITGEVSTKYAAQRGNQITIKFKNILTAPTKDTLCKDVADCKKMVSFIKEQDELGPFQLK